MAPTTQGSRQSRASCPLSDARPGASRGGFGIRVASGRGFSAENVSSIGTCPRGGLVDQMEKRRTYMLLPGSWTEKFSFDFRGAVLRSSSSLSGDQRVAAVAWFEKGLADTATAKMLGVSRWPVKRLYRRWRIHGQGALVTKPAQSYTFEFKLALVERFLAGETAPDLAAEAGLSSAVLSSSEGINRAVCQNGPKGVDVIKA
jgi:hypothetical protein